MKKSLSIMLVVIMLVGMIPMNAMAASEEEMSIDTAEKLIEFIKAVNNGDHDGYINAVLTADIDISYTEYIENVSDYEEVGYDDQGDFSLTTPIGCDEDHPFKGTFDGNNFSIEFMFDSDENAFDGYGLFGINYGTIKNLTVGFENSGHQYFFGTQMQRLNAGGVCGTNYGTIENCVNYVTVTAGNTAGGIVGTNYGTVDGCVNYGYVGAGNKAGGIVGTNCGTVINCLNYGEVEAGHGSGIIDCGGIAGLLTNGGKVLNCANFGKVTVAAGNAGGIVGSADGGEIVACFAGGTVTGSNAHAVVGGSNGATITGNYYEIKDGFSGDDNAEGIEKAQIENGYAVSLLRDTVKNIDGAKKWYKGADGYPSFEGEDVPPFLTKTAYYIAENGVVTVGGTGEVPTDAFKDNTNVKEIVLDGGITSVKANAFAGCTNLHKITVNAQSITFERGSLAGITGADAFTVEKADGAKDDTAGNKIGNAVSGSIKAVYIHRFDRARDKVTAPTCTAEGYTTHFCRDCDFTHTDTVTKPTGHHYKQKRLADKVVASTCTEKGSITHYCDDCDFSYTEETAATGHYFDKSEKCTKCSASYSANVVGSETVHFEGAEQLVLTIRYNAPSNSSVWLDIISAKGHQEMWLYGDKQQQFILDGEWVTCPVFLRKDIQSSVFPIYNDNEVTVQPTCVEEGYKSYTYGGEVYKKETIAATGHYFDKNGKCTKCSKDYSLMVFTLEETVHFEGVEQVILSIRPDFEQTWTTGNNIIWGENYNQEVMLKGRTQYIFKVDGDWVSYSLNSCLERYYTVSAIPVYGDNKVVVESTCANDGYIEYTYCGKTYKETFPATGHHFDKNGKCTKCALEYASFAFPRSATLTFEGAEQVILLITGNYPSIHVSQSGNTVRGQNYNNEFTICGKTQYVFEVDGDWVSYSLGLDNPATISAIPVYGDNKVVVDPTCTNDGYIECTYCGKTYKAKTLSATGHGDIIRDGKCIVCGDVIPFMSYSKSYTGYDKTIIYSGADSITVMFKMFDHDISDYLHVYDGSGNEVAVSGFIMNNMFYSTVTVSGDTVRIAYPVDDLGDFEIESITPNYSEGVELTPTEETPAEETPTTPEQTPNGDKPADQTPAQETQPENSSPSNTASVLSEGNLWIILTVAVLAVGGVAALYIVKKKKKPVLANSASDSDDE